MTAQNQDEDQIIPLINDQDSLNNSDPLEDGKKMCRICFDDDSTENMFIPCKCFGDQKWVHPQCLDDWRVASANSEAFTRCLTCQHEYHIQVQESNNGCMDKVGQGLIRNGFCLCLTLLGAIILGGMFIKRIDSSKLIYKFFMKYVFNHPITTDTIYYYYVFMAYVFLFLLIIGTCINILRMKNRWLYLRFWLGNNWKCGIFRISILLILTLLTFYLNVYLGCIILTLETQSIISMHYMYLHYHVRANQNKILAYRDQSENIIEYV